MMRDYMYDLVANPARPLAAVLHAIIPPERIASSGSADEFVRPFMVIRAGAEARVMGDVWQCPFTFHVHDEPESYVQIDLALRAVHDIMEAAAEVDWNGSWVMSVSDNGISDDLYDDHYGTATRNAAYTLTVRR